MLCFCLVTLLGIICLKYLRITTKKTKFTNSFQVIKKDMAQAIDEISNLLENIKLAKDNFLGKDLSVERNFCYAVSEQVGKVLKDCEVSTFLCKNIMAICFETFALNESTGKKLLKVTDEMVDKHFFKNDGLLQLGWCSQYKIDSRIMHYLCSRIMHYLRPLINEIVKTYIVEFYWLNNSKN